MKKLILSLCMFLALIACKDEEKTAAKSDSKPVVKIGVIYPMSGNYAHFGDAMKTALKMFEDEEQTKCNDCPAPAARVTNFCKAVARGQ